MATPSDVYLKARELIDTPWLHQGRLPGVGIDCIGVPIWVMKELGLGDYDTSDYPRDPDGTMQSKIEAVFPKINLQPGALLVFKVRSYAQHCGIVSNYLDGLGLIHAWDVAGCTCEHRLNQQWIERIVGVYGFPGVDYGV